MSDVIDLGDVIFVMLTSGDTLICEFDGEDSSGIHCKEPFYYEETLNDGDIIPIISPFLQYSYERLFTFPNKHVIMYNKSSKRIAEQYFELIESIDDIIEVELETEDDNEVLTLE